VSSLCISKGTSKPILYLSSVDRNKYQIQIPLPPKIDASVTMMQVEEKPDVTYSDIGGCKEQIEKLREVVELPLLSVLSNIITCSDPCLTSV
jgi:26S proteasome regulatory subunit T1